MQQDGGTCNRRGAPPPTGASPSVSLLTTGAFILSPSSSFPLACRSLPNVILGGYGTPAPPAGGAKAVAAPQGSHKEIDVAGMNGCGGVKGVG